VRTTRGHAAVRERCGFASAEAQSYEADDFPAAAVAPERCRGGTVTGPVAFGSSPRKNQVMEENRMKSEWSADPLVWGHGPTVFEMFLEPTCPFSVKAFGKLDDLLGQAGEDRITVKLRLHSQPWHMYSGVIVRCILAASTLESGKAAAKSVMAAIAAHREEFEFDRHCGGSNLDATPNDIIRRIERYSGVKVAEAFAIPDLDREVKWHCKYARQNGIHVSPTFMIDGLVQADVSSGDSVADWLSRLRTQWARNQT
jgi:hypothetical protein